MTGADLILIGGRVRALGSGPDGEAVAVRGGRIAAVGGRDDILSLRGPRSEVVDVAGGTVLPAFTDSHTHFKRASLVLAMFLDFDEVAPASVADVTAAVARRHAELPPGAWLQGDSLNSVGLAEDRFPDRHELDAAAPGRPVVLRGVGRHVVAANSLALRAAGIDRHTPDPSGGRIDRDHDGEPTGVLHEQAQLGLDANRADTVVPVPGVAERVAALRSGVALLSRMGIAQIHEIPREPDQIGDWLRLRETDEPAVRVRFYVRGVGAQTKLEYLLGLGLRSGFGDEWLRLGGVKISIDGSCIYRNAMVYDAYPGQPDNLGLQRVEEGELREAVRLAHHGGLQIAVHAIGPRAVDLALDAFAALGECRDALAVRRHRIEHAYLPGPPGQLERLRDLGLMLSTQPSFIEHIGDAWVEIFQDPELRGAMPVGSALRLGVPVQINSDYPCSKLNPWIGVKAAVDRTTAAGRVLDAGEAVTVEQALQLMTATAAWSAFEEGWRGRLAPGYAADLMVTDLDPLAVDPGELADITTLRTIVGGRTTFVHEASG